MCHHPCVKREEGEDQDTPVINDKFWSFDFLIVKAHRMKFLDDILGFDLPSPL